MKSGPNLIFYDEALRLTEDYRNGDGLDDSKCEARIVIETNPAT